MDRTAKVTALMWWIIGIVFVATRGYSSPASTRGQTWVAMASICCSISSRVRLSRAKSTHEVSYPQGLVLPDVQGDLGRSADKRVAVV